MKVSNSSGTHVLIALVTTSPLFFRVQISTSVLMSWMTVEKINQVYFDNLKRHLMWFDVLTRRRTNLCLVERIVLRKIPNPCLQFRLGKMHHRWSIRRFLKKPWPPLVDLPESNPIFFSLFNFTFNSFTFRNFKYLA